MREAILCTECRCISVTTFENLDEAERWMVAHAEICGDRDTVVLVTASRLLADMLSQAGQLPNMAHYVIGGMVGVDEKI